MHSRSLLSLAALTTAWFAATPAHAHVSLDAPKSRYWQTSAMQADQNKLKNGPCGAKGDARTGDASLITTYKPGEKVMVKWKETVQHPGHFEISFDSDGQGFSDAGYGASRNLGVSVLAANIADKSSTDYTYEVTLPNMECSKCTLQLVQVMTTNAPPYAAGDLYFNCADIIIKADGAGGSGGASSSGGTGNAGATSGGTNGGSGSSGSAGTGQGTAGAGFGGTNTAGVSGMGPVAGMTGVAGMTMTAGAGGAPNPGFGGMAGSNVAGTAAGTPSGGATASGGAPATSGGTLSTNGGAPLGTGGTLIASGGTGTLPPTGTPEDPGAGCSLAHPSSPSAWGWVVAAAGALAFEARRRRRRTR